MNTGKCICYPNGASHNGICFSCISDKLSKGKITDEQARQAAEGMSLAERHAALHKSYTDYVEFYTYLLEILRFKA